MKKIYVLLVALGILPLAIDVNAQTEFAPLGAQWCYTDGHAIPMDYLKRYVSERDTIIDGSKCRIISKYSYQPETCKEYIILKQDGGKVYFHHLNKFNLLFDFDAKVGEEIEFTFKFKKHLNDGNGRVVDTILSARYIIERVDNISIGTRDLKTIETKILSEDIANENGMSISFGTYCYTEMIGSDYEFIPSVTNIPETTDVCRNLRCYSDSNVSFITKWWTSFVLPCDYHSLVAVNEIDEEFENNLEIYPNPIKEHIYISSKNSTSLTIRNILGQIIYNSKIPKGITEISAESFPNGLLFIESRCESDKLQTYKIIKR